MSETLLEEKIVAIQKDARDIYTQVETLNVVDEVSLNKGAELLAKIKARIKRVNELRLFFVAPLNDQVKAINNKFKVELEPLQEMQDTVSNRLVRYQELQEKKAEEEARRLQIIEDEKRKKEQAEIERKEREAAELEAKAAKSKSAKRKAELEAEAEAKKKEAEAIEDKQALAEIPVVEAPKKTVRTHAGLVTFKKHWTFEVEDEALLRKTHPELFVLDTVAVNKKISEGEREIAGLRIFQKTGTAGRT